MVMESLERLDPPRTLGKLTLLGRLGEGGMASVYVASIGDGPLARLAAVKLLRADVPDHGYRARFLDEAKLVVRLHHNNLVDVREAGEVAGQLYIAMELIEGRDLADIWDRCAALGRAFPVPLAVVLIREILRGLHYAHTFPGLSLVHRDVSPSNILVDWAGAVRLADFGLATSALKAEMTVPGMVFGKVGYMAPEQATHALLDARADVYGCGVVLWELLTGRPLRGPAIDTKTVATFEAAPPSTLSRRVDPELDEIVARALEHDPNDRYPTAHAFMEACSGWLSRHAPDTNQETVAAFLRGLFEDARERDHELFAALLTTSPRTGVWERSSRRSGPTRFVSPEGAAPSGESELIAEGTLVAGRYSIRNVIGQGGMGTVYLAEHVRVGRKVAVKVLTHEWSTHETVARRFQEEARAASAAGHPNIVEVFDAGELPDGRLYLVMEYLTGRSLYEVFKEERQLPVARACHVGREVARAVRAAHDVGIVHRDLKPDNVMLVERGGEEGIKVLDFGISAQAVREADDQRITRPGHAVGTPEYMAPEQARGGMPTPQFDIYALGVLLYEALSGRPPFASDNFVEVLARKATEQVPDIRTARPDVPRALAELLRDCLAIDPAQRPVSMTVVLDALDRVGPAVEDAAVAFGLPAMSSEFAAARRRHKLIGGATAATLVLAIMVLGWSVLQARPSDSSVQPRETRVVVAPPVSSADEDNGAAPPRASERGEAASTFSKPLVQPEARRGDPPAEGSALANGTASPSSGRSRARASADGGTQCRAERQEAEETARGHRWPQLLEQLSSSRCWRGRHRSRYLALKVRAFFETKRFGECAELGRGATDEQTRALAEACEQRGS